jgi:hypothetical protein
LTKGTPPHFSKTLEGLDFWETLRPGSDTHSFAQAGFLYEFKQDQTRCLHCNIVLKQWEDSDCPYLEHVRHSPDCPFAQGILKRKTDFELQIEKIQTSKLKEDTIISTPMARFNSGIAGWGGFKE